MPASLLTSKIVPPFVLKKLKFILLSLALFVIAGSASAFKTNYLNPHRNSDVPFRFTSGDPIVFCNSLTVSTTQGTFSLKCYTTHMDGAIKMRQMEH